MNTTTNSLRASLLVEWWDERLGAEVYGAMVAVLRAAGATDFTVPHTSAWLTYAPRSEGKYHGEGELLFTFRHGLSWEDGETSAVTQALREVARVKCLCWDEDAEDDYGD